MAARGALLVGTLWVAAAATATSVGLVAVHLVGAELGDPVSAPLSGEGVEQALGSVSPVSTPTASARPTASPPSPGPASTVTTAGGVVSARCVEHVPALLYAVPAEGYRTERWTQSGALVVRFLGSAWVVTVSLTCSDERLVTSTRTDQVAPATTAPKPPPAPAPTTRPSDTPDSDTTGDRTPQASDG